MNCPLTTDFANLLLCTFLQASIVTVIHLVNAVVDTVNKKGIVMCVLFVCLLSPCH